MDMCVALELPQKGTERAHNYTQPRCCVINDGVLCWRLVSFRLICTASRDCHLLPRSGVGFTLAVKPPMTRPCTEHVTKTQACVVQSHPISSLKAMVAILTTAVVAMTGLSAVQGAFSVTACTCICDHL